MKRLFPFLLILALFYSPAFGLGESPISGSGSSTANASDLSSGTIPAARIGDNSVTVTKVQCTGAKDNTTYLRMDGSCATPAGTGDVVGPASATDGYFALWDNTTGKLLKDGFSSVNPAFSTINVTGANALNLGTGSTNAGSARFKNATNNFYFQILGGVSGADIGWTLPTAAPAGNGYWITASTTGVLTYTNGALYATLADPTFTGTPAAPTAAADTDTTQVATTAYVIGQGYAKLVSPSFTTPTLGVATATTLSTGQGQYELYAMDQNVRTTDNVAFGTVTADEFISSAADNTRGVTVPDTADPTGANLAAGKCWWNTTGNAWTCRNGDNTVTTIVGAQVKTFSFVIDNVVAATDNILLTRIPRAWTITRADCYASTDNVVGNLMECSTSDVTSCSVLDAWTVTNATNPFSDTSMTDGAVAAGAWIRWSTTSVGTTNSNKLSCTIQYRE